MIIIKPTFSFPFFPDENRILSQAINKLVCFTRTEVSGFLSEERTALLHRGSARTGWREKSRDDWSKNAENTLREVADWFGSERKTRNSY